jgi:hypothetical protein
MCLWIYHDQEKNERNLEGFLGGNDEVYVYKVLGKFLEEKIYRSYYYYNTIWDFSKQNVFKVDRSSKPTKYELKIGNVEEGLYAYTTLSHAAAMKIIYSVIAKFKVRKEDIVAVEGYFYEEIVCRRLEFVEFFED